MFCRQQVAELATRHAEFTEKKAELVVIGNGEIKDLPPFRQASGFRGQLLTDPSREAYKVLDFRAGLTAVLGLKSLIRGITALAAGVKPGLLHGDALQLGGAVVIDPDSRIRYFYRSAEAGDHPPVDALLGALS